MIDPVNLTFDAESHLYHYNGRQIPSVTQVIKSAGLIDDRWFREEHADFGNLIHHMIALHVSGRLQEGTLSDDVAPYLVAVKNFLRMFAPGSAFSAECRIIGPSLDYAGTADLVVVYVRRWFIDFKTGAKAKWHRLQTAAYADAISQNCKRGCVYLRDNGTYSCDWHEDRSDFDAWRGALALSNWRLNHGG